MKRITHFFNSGSERSVKYKKNTLYMLVLKGISICISLLYVPLLLNSLNTENYGIWLTLTSIVSWVAMLDIGLGNGLRNKLAEALAKDDFILARKYVSSAYIALGFYIALFIFLFSIFAYYFISWNDVLNAPNIPQVELSTLVLIVFISFGMHFLLNLLNSILLALQLPALSSLVSTLGQIISLILVLICVKLFNIKSLLILGSIVSIAPVIVLALASIILFFNKFKYLKPCFRYYDSTLIKDILKLGINFFIIQIMTIILYQSNNLVITHLVGNEGVVEYNIAFKYVQVLNILYMIIVTPMWSATTQAYVKEDFQWIISVNKKLNKIAILFSVIGILMVIASPYIYKLWLFNDNLHIMYSTTIILLSTEILKMFYGNYGYIINGIGKLHAQLVITLLLAIIYVPLIIFSGNIAGLQGILSVGIFINLCNVLWSKYQFKALMNKEASNFWNK